MEITIRNNQRQIKIDLQRAERILRKALKYLTRKYRRRYYFLESAEISVLFVNDRKMRELNQQYRGKDKTTDVLSFPQNPPYPPFTKGGIGGITYPTSIIGDIVINLPQAKRQALEHGLTFYEEVIWLLIHGLLHLLGYDHEKNKYQARKMREMEQELLGVLE